MGAPSGRRLSAASVEQRPRRVPSGHSERRRFGLGGPHRPIRRARHKSAPPTRHPIDSPGAPAARSLRPRAHLTRQLSARSDALAPVPPSCTPAASGARESWASRPAQGARVLTQLAAGAAKWLRAPAPPDRFRRQQDYPPRARSAGRPAGRLRDKKWPPGAMINRANLVLRAPLAHARVNLRDNWQSPSYEHTLSGPHALPLLPRSLRPREQLLNGRRQRQRRRGDTSAPPSGRALSVGVAGRWELARVAQLAPDCRWRESIEFGHLVPLLLIACCGRRLSAALFAQLARD